MTQDPWQRAANRAGVTVEEADRWIAVFATPDQLSEARHWVAAGWPPEAARRLRQLVLGDDVNSHVLARDRIHEVIANRSPDEVLAWTDDKRSIVWFEFHEFPEWSTHGFDLATALAWSAMVTSPADALLLIDEGFSPDSARPWTSVDLSGEHILAWHRMGFNAHRTGEWRRLNVSVELAEEWRKAGFEPAEAAAWRSVGLEPQRATRWVRAGFEPDAAQAWADADVDPNAAAEWRDAGISTSEALRWVDAGVDVAAAVRRREAGLNPPAAPRRRVPRR